MAVSGRLPAHPPGCKWGCRRNLGHCLPHSCFWEITQSWVIQVQPHCSRSGSKADLGRRTGASRRGGLQGRVCPLGFPRRCLCSQERRERGHCEGVRHKPLPSTTTAVSRPFLLLSRPCVWHCWSRKLGRPLGQGGFSQTACSTLAPRQCVPPGPGLEGREQSALTSRCRGEKTGCLVRVSLARRGERPGKVSKAPPPCSYTPVPHRWHV